MAANLGQAYVQVVPSAEGISGKIAQIFSPEAESAGKSSGSTLGTTIVKTVAALGIGKTVSDSISNGMNFESGMAKVSTLFSGTSKEFNELTNSIMGISSETGVAASQLAEAAYSAESASVPMGNLGSMISGSAKLATAGFTDIDTALSATAKTMNAYGMMSDDVTKTQENMEKVQRVLIQTQNKGITTVGELGASLAQVTPTAAAMGVSFENVGASLAVMTAKGTPTAQATTQLNNLISELGKTGTTASDILKEKTGKSFQELTKDGYDLSDIIGFMTKDMEGLSGVTERANEIYAAQSDDLKDWDAAFEEAMAGVPGAEENIIDMFGSLQAGKAALAITSDADKFKEDLEAMSTSSDVVGEAFSKMSDTASFKLDKLKNTLTNIGISAFMQVADGFTGALEGIQQVIEGVAPAFSTLGGAVTEFLGAFSSAAGEMLGISGDFSITQAVVDGISAAVNALAGAFSFLTEHMDIVLPVLAGLGSAFVAFKAISGIAGIVTTITGITTAISGAGGVIAAITALLGPFGLVAVAIGVAIAAGVAIYKNWDTIKKQAQVLAKSVSAKWNALKTSVLLQLFFQYHLYNLLKTLRNILQ